ncbi:MAG: hypothetical protein RIR47_43 [Bacteroidota bacterium]
MDTLYPIEGEKSVSTLTLSRGCPTIGVLSRLLGARLASGLIKSRKSLCRFLFGLQAGLFSSLRHLLRFLLCLLGSGDSGTVNANIGFLQFDVATRNVFGIHADTRENKRVVKPIIRGARPLDTSDDTIVLCTVNLGLDHIASTVLGTSRIPLETCINELVSPHAVVGIGVGHVVSIGLHRSHDDRPIARSLVVHNRVCTLGNLRRIVSVEGRRHGCKPLFDALHPRPLRGREHAAFLNLPLDGCDEFAITGAERRKPLMRLNSVNSRLASGSIGGVNRDGGVGGHAMRPAAGTVERHEESPLRLRLYYKSFSESTGFLNFF